MNRSNRQPLDHIRAGKTVRVAAIEAGKELKNRLASLGLFVNVEIRIVRNDGAGQMIINVKNSNVILGRGMSHKIFAVEI